MMLLSRWLYYLSSIPTLLLGVKNWWAMLAVMLYLPIRKPVLIELRNGFRFLVRTPLDVWIVKETCLDRLYQRASVEPRDGWTIIDVGAGFGDLVVSVAKEHPRATIYAYEPLPNSFALLEENLKLNHIENVKAFPCAIGARSGSMELCAVTREPTQSTPLSGKRDGSVITVPSVSLVQVFEEQGFARCDYMKMDCEGGEFEIFFNTDAATLHKIKHICLEYHDDVTPFTHADLVNYFQENGFRVKLVPNRAHWQWGLLYAENLLTKM